MTSFVKLLLLWLHCQEVLKFVSINWTYIFPPMFLGFVCFVFAVFSGFYDIHGNDTMTALFQNDHSNWEKRRETKRGQRDRLKKRETVGQRLQKYAYCVISGQFSGRCCIFSVLVLFACAKKILTKVPQSKRLILSYSFRETVSYQMKDLVIGIEHVVAWSEI